MSGDGRRIPAKPATSGLPSRRRFLQATGALAGAAAVPGLLAACGGDEEESGGGQSPSANPSPGSTLAGGTVRFWSVTEGPEDEAFQRAKFDEFMAANPDVTVEPQFFPTTQIAEAMNLAFTGGDAPDIFRQAGTTRSLDLFGAYGRGWVRPIDEFLTDEFKQRFPDWVYNPDQSALFVEGEAYGVPFFDPKVYGTRVLLYNASILEDNGFSEPPETWSEMREMVAKITTDGNGNVYGTAPAAWNPNYDPLQALAGPSPYRNIATMPISLLTGEPAMSEPSTIAVVEYLQGMQADELYTVGWEAWEGHQQYLEQMVSGRLAMYIFPIFHVALIRAANPDLDLGIASVPLPDDGRAGSIPASDSITAWWMMTSEVREPEAAWRVMDFLGSVDFQGPAYTELNQVSLMPAVWEGVEVSDDTARLREIAETDVRSRPRPETKNPGAVQFYNDLAAESPRPTPKEILLDAISRGSDYAALAADYDAQVADLIEQQMANSDVTMDAFTFPDWNPLEDYGA